MERVTAGGNIITRNLFLITVSLFYAAAMAGPVWGLGWDSPVLAPWTALVLALAVAGLWRYLKPGRSYPKTDLSFIVPIVMAVNLFSVLLGDGGEWVRPMNYLLVALCALYYSIWFNFAVAGVIFALELANVFLAHAQAGAQAFVNLGVYGAWLCGIPLVLGRLFHSEYRKKEQVLREMRRLTEGVETLNPEQAESDSIKSISAGSRDTENMDAAADLERGMRSLLDTARAACRADNAHIFLPDKGGETVSLRVSAGEGGARAGHLVEPGQGLIGWVLKEKRPLLARDRAAGLDYMEAAGAVRSFLAVPVQDGGHMEGIIALDSYREEAFSEADRETMELFGTVAMNMIRGARLFMTVGQTADTAKKLHRISSEISSSLDLPTILDRLSVMIAEIVPYDYLTISFVEPDGMLGFKVLKGYGSAAPAGPVPMANSYLGWIVQQNHKFSFNDFDRRTSKMPIFPAKELQTDFRSFLGLPIASQGRVLGVLTVCLRRPGGISAPKQDMLGIVADQVAVNIANASLHQTIKLMATTDGLTGLINHRHFQEKADERFTRAARFPEEISLLLFDIDHFKKVNDTFGHPVGDAVLKKVARVIRETVRTIDVAARYGGEEFAVLMEQTDEAGAMKMAERIRTTIQKTKFVFEGNTVPVTVSIGCATHPSHARDKKDLIDKADRSLYWAKRNGRNRCCPFSAIMGEKHSPAENC